MNTQEGINHQKAVADEVLDKLYSVDPFCIVAGGAPRDWYMNSLATDIDVFFYAPYSQWRIEKLLKHVGIVPASVKTGDSIPDWYKLNPDLRVVYELELRGVKVQIMLMKKTTHDCVVTKFPVSISKVWYKRKEISTTADFRYSIESRCILQTSELYADSHAYIQKIKAKFPGWPWYSKL